MASDGILGFGATLTVAPTSATSTTTALGNIQALNVSGLEREDIDISNMDSTGMAREFLAGMYTGGTIDVDMIYDPTASGTIDLLVTAFQAGTKYTWAVTCSDGTKFVCIGYIKSLDPMNIAYDGTVTAKVTIKLTGVAAYTDLA